MNYVVLDLETSMRQIDDRKKSYSDPLKGDVILTLGLKYKNKDAIALDQDYMPKGFLEDIDLIIGHNIAFDLKFIWRNDELQNFFRRGGRIWDTQLVEYILSGQRHKYPALRDIAVNKYNRPERIKHLEGRNTEETPIDLLLEDVRNDVLDTEAVALQQAKTAKVEGMMGLILTQMDARLCTIEMEFNGFKVDIELLKANQKELEDQLEPLLAEVSELAKPYWPEELEFNVQSATQLGKLFFGGTYKAKEKTPDGIFKNGNTKYKTEIVEKNIKGFGMRPHRDWYTPGGKISVNEKILKAIVRKVE